MAKNETTIATHSGTFEFSRSDWPVVSQRDLDLLDAVETQLADALIQWCAESLINEPPTLYLAEDGEVRCWIWEIGKDTMQAKSNIVDLTRELLEERTDYLGSPGQIDEAREVVTAVKQTFEAGLALIREAEGKIIAAEKSRESPDMNDAQNDAAGEASAND